MERRIVFGKTQDINNILENSPVSQTISTSFVERNNLTLRQNGRRLTRKTNGFSRVLRNLEAQVILVMAYYNFVLSHGALKIKGQRERTPAMAAWLTDHKSLSLFFKNWSDEIRPLSPLVVNDSD